MTQLKLTLMAILAFCGRLFALPTSAARGKSGGFNFLRALAAVCILAVMTACGGGGGSGGGNNAFACKYRDLDRAISIGSATDVKCLIDAGAYLEKAQTGRYFGGWTPLYSAVVGADTADEIQKVLFLIQAGANVNVKSDDGTTPLHHTNKELVLPLIKAGADVNAKNNKGDTPLHWQAESGDIKAAHALIKAGADIEAKNNEGLTPLYKAIKRDEFDTAFALIVAGADANARPGGSNILLRIASKEGATDAALVLVKKGADIHAKDKNGDMPLHLSVKAGKSNTAIALIEAGTDINAQGENGYTALHIVADKESSDNALKLAVALIKRGANVKLKNDFGETPRDLAISKHGEKSRIARLLLKHEGKE